jgi:hypothetical protein
MEQYGMDAAKNFKILGEHEIADLIREDGFSSPPPSGSRRGGVLSHSLTRRPLFDDVSGTGDAPYWGTWGTA